MPSSMRPGGSARRDGPPRRFASPDTTKASYVMTNLEADDDGFPLSEDTLSVLRELPGEVPTSDRDLLRILESENGVIEENFDGS